MEYGKSSPRQTSIDFVRGRKTPGKRGYRRNSYAGSKGRFLQHIFPGSEEKRGIAPGNKSKTIKQFYSKETFQDGYFGGLRNLSRSERCLSPYSNAQIPQEISSFLCKREMLPIQSNVLRSSSSAESVYKDCYSCSSLLANTQYTPLNVPGRLVYSKLGNNGGAVRSRDDFRHSFETGVHNQFRQIISDSKSNNYLPWQSVKTSFGTSFSHDRKDRENAIQILITRENSVFQFHVLGLMISCIEIVPFARLHMRPIQLHLLSFWKPVSRDMLIRIPITKHLIGHLKWWLLRANTLKGRSLPP